MRLRPPRLFDTSALIDLFRGYEPLQEVLDEAERGSHLLLLPTTAMADAEAVLHAGFNGWEAILHTRGVRSLPLAEHTAIDIGVWPGKLPVRHAAHEAAAVRGVVVTPEPQAYQGLTVPLLVI